MVDRINFLKKGKYILTYKRMLQYAVIWVVALAAVFSLLIAYNWINNKRLESSKVFLEQLNAKKQRTEALVEAAKFKHTGSSVKEVALIYATFPSWSEVMRDLAESMPRQLWLTSISSTAPSQSPASRKLEIQGKSRNNSNVATFLENLNKKTLFKNVVLSKSVRDAKEGQRDYNFDVNGEITFREKKWN